MLPVRQAGHRAERVKITDVKCPNFLGKIGFFHLRHVVQGF
jgi:hypothetical protein